MAGANAMSSAVSNAMSNVMSDPATTTRRPLFLPTARQANWLVVIGFLAVGEALYLRFMAIENANMARACQGGLSTWLCSTYRVTIPLFEHEVFGALALAVALVNLMRPSVVLVGLALVAAAFGLVLHNGDLAGIAVGVLILSLARRAPASE
jgi:hypothetical protein